jgi:hypothetical protein
MRTRREPIGSGEANFFLLAAAGTSLFALPVTARAWPLLVVDPINAQVWAEFGPALCFLWGLTGVFLSIPVLARWHVTRIVVDGVGVRGRPSWRYGKARYFAWAAVRGWRTETYLTWHNDNGEGPPQTEPHEEQRLAVELTDGRVMLFEEHWRGIVAEELARGPAGDAEPGAAADRGRDIGFWEFVAHSRGPGC